MSTCFGFCLKTWLLFVFVVPVSVSVSYCCKVVSVYVSEWMDGYVCDAL